VKDLIEINSFAVQLRKKFGEDMSSPIDVFSIINNLNNFTLVFYPMSSKISGMCVRIGEIEKLIAINSTLSHGRQRFSASHELYHLFFQKDFKNVICGIELETTKDPEEMNADAFASYFLAPYDALKIFISELNDHNNNQLSLADIIKIEQYFQMSRQATLYRLMREKLISVGFANTLKTDVSRSARRLGYDDSLYIPTPKEKQYLTTGSYIGLLEKLKNKDLISQGKYEEYLLEAYRPDIVYNLNSSGEEKYD
jgi:Zn-dependent peptidase ImmA (M78 family)